MHITIGCENAQNLLVTYWVTKPAAPLTIFYHLIFYHLIVTSIFLVSAILAFSCDFSFSIILDLP